MIIKFRSWNVEEKIMHDIAFPSWNGMHEVWADNKPQSEVQYLSNGPAEEGRLMQFTTIKDKNGKDIYHKDIVKCNWLAELGITEIDCEAIGVVEWSDENPCFYIELLKPYLRKIAEEMDYETEVLPLAVSTEEGITIEIIGNIYTNPELITK